MRHPQDFQPKHLQRFFSSHSNSTSLHEISIFCPEPRLLPNGLEPNLKTDAPGWYTNWLISQLTTLPDHIYNIFHTKHKDCTPQSHWDLLNRVFIRVGEHIIQNNSISIDGIIENLLNEDVLNSEMLVENLNHIRYLIFALLGYQSMLYSTPTSDLTSEPPRQLRIAETRGCCSYTHVSLTQDIATCSHEPLSELLMGFGVLLPSMNLCLDDDQDIQHTFQKGMEVNPKSFNAYALHYIAGIKVKWTDALACHLEFNSATKEVSLFRFPSFCQFSLARYKQGNGRGVLHACATTSRLRCQWATEAEINHFLLEVLLSYRLLFGQTKKSRALFRSIDPFLRGKERNRKMKDPLLSQLCGMRSLSVMLLDLRRDWDMVERETYYLPNDFPILRYRMVVLQKSLSASAPRTWLQLWKDNRNSANWMTFWAVILFGAFGSLMAALQVILQFVQLFM